MFICVVSLGLAYVLQLIERNPETPYVKPSGDDRRLASLQRQSDDLRTELLAQSNRADSAEQKYREEKETHEPLRKQIEQMMAQETRNRVESDKKLADLQKKLDDAAKQSKTEIDRLNGLLEQAEKEAERLKAELENLRSASVTATNSTSEGELPQPDPYTTGKGTNTTAGDTMSVTNRVD
jgi:chromosome segregation ATPase